MGSNFHATIATGNTDSNSRDIQLMERRYESRAEFSRLAEEQGDLPGTVNDVSAVGKLGVGGGRSGL